MQLRGRHAPAQQHAADWSELQAVLHRTAAQRVASLKVLCGCGKHWRNKSLSRICTQTHRSIANIWGADKMSATMVRHKSRPALLHTMCALVRVSVQSVTSAAVVRAACVCRVLHPVIVRIDAMAGKINNPICMRGSRFPLPDEVSVQAESAHVLRYRFQGGNHSMYVE
jgi:hypothetical protein